MAELPPYINGH